MADSQHKTSPTTANAEPRSGKFDYSAPSLEKGLAIVEFLSRQKGGKMASEIATGMGLSLNEIYRILVVMERMGWLRKVYGEKYTVTPLVLAIAFRATPAAELSTVGMPFMKDFCDATDQSCHLVIRNGDSGLIVATCQNPGSTGFHMRVGSEIDLATSCSGHVLLAYTDNPAKSEYSNNPDKSGLSSFGTVLNAIRQRGFERMESATTLGVTDISFPIFDLLGEAVAALTVPFLRRIDGRKVMSLEETQEHLAQTAHRISSELSAPQSHATTLDVFNRHVV